MRLNNVRIDDEISLYLRGRYLCSMDCYWRILGHETYPASSPAVKIIKVISDQSASALNPNILLEPLASHDQLTESDDPHNILKQMLTDDVLNNFNNNGVPPHLLQLKVNDICIVLRNLNKKEGLTNNTRVRILNITPKCIRIQTLTSNKKCHFQYQE